MVHYNERLVSRLRPASFFMTFSGLTRNKDLTKFSGFGRILSGGENMEELKLSREQLGIVISQCQNCNLWDDNDGCAYENRADEFPVENCLIYEENRK